MGLQVRAGVAVDAGHAPSLRRAGRDHPLETAYCAEIVAITHEAMGLLAAGRGPTSWYDPGRFWGWHRIRLTGDFRLGNEVAVELPDSG